MLQIQWKKDARNNLLSVLAYIAEDNIDAARRFKKELESRIETLTDFPQAFKHGRIQGTREMVLSSKYIVVYAENS